MAREFCTKCGKSIFEVCWSFYRPWKPEEGIRERIELRRKYPALPYHFDCLPKEVT